MLFFFTWRVSGEIATAWHGIKCGTFIGDPVIIDDIAAGLIQTLTVPVQEPMLKASPGGMIGLSRISERMEDFIGITVHQLGHSLPAQHIN